MPANLLSEAQEHGIEYERTHFRKKLEAGTVTLQLTTLWLQHVVKLAAEGSHWALRQTDLASSTLAAARQRNISILCAASVDLVVDYPHWGGVTRTRASMDEIPETLALDLLRLKVRF